MSEVPKPKSVAIDQRIAVFVVKWLARTPISPNMVTGFSMIVGLAAAWLYAEGGDLAYWGAGIFVIAVWMDHVDGELARATGKTSEFGHYFDHAAAMFNYVAMFVGAGIGLRDGGFGDDAILFGTLAGIGIAAIMSVRMYEEMKLGRSSVKQTVRAGFEIEDTLYVAAPITWLGFIEQFIVLAGIGAPMFLFYVLWDLSRKMRMQGTKN